MKNQYIKGLVTKANEEGTYTVLASTNSVDRQGDVVDQGGWDLANFKQNPVVLWAHKYDELPVAKATRIEVTKRGLEMDFEFANFEKALQVKELFDGGFLNAVSVGFIPRERKGNMIVKSELLEVSIVPVPANQDALRLAMSKGLDISTIMEDIQKGEVQDVIDEQDSWEAKYANCDAIHDILSAFYTVYFDGNTPVEDFSKLLSETVNLLQAVADGSYVDPEDDEAKSKNLVFKTKFVELVSSKEGRVLSEKNRELIKNAIQANKATVTVLEDLYSATESSSEKGNGEIADVEVQEQEVDEEKEQTITLSIEEALTVVKGAMRGIDRTSESVLTLINKFQAKQETLKK